MRLTHFEVMGIINGIDPFIKFSAELRLYGSRLDDDRKGGDIDLMLIVPSEIKNNIKEIKHKILAGIKKNIGDRQVDFLICDISSTTSDPFIELIFPSSLLLKKWVT